MFSSVKQCYAFAELNHCHYFNALNQGLYIIDSITMKYEAADNDVNRAWNCYNTSSRQNS